MIESIRTFELEVARLACNVDGLLLGWYLKNVRPVIELV
jgi:hypothetical protein